jgi:N-methylhydantoinase B
MIGIFNALPEAIPANAGSFRPIDFEIRPGSIAGGVEHPYSCSAATTNLADRLANAVQRALAELLDGYGLAEAGLAMPPSLPVISGRDEGSDGERFVNQVCLASTGGPGGPEADGWLTIVHVGNAGVLLRDSVETDEHRYPLRVVSQRLLPDTEGAGRNRGAPSVEVVFESTTSELEVIFACDGNTEPARGARGGEPGGRSAQRLRRADDKVVPVGGFETAILRPGEAIIATTCGGGGYGPPLERALEAVAHDVVDGWISPARARAVYGVEVDGEGDIDIEQTARLRTGREWR